MLLGHRPGISSSCLQKVEGMCGAWIHTPHVWGSHMCGAWIHTPQTCLGKPMRHKESPCATKKLNLSLCHVCVKFVTHKHVHAPQRKSIPVCVTFGEVIRDKQSWFCHSCPMRHIPHVTSLLFSCSGSYRTLYQGNQIQTGYYPRRGSGSSHMANL